LQRCIVDAYANGLTRFYNNYIEQELSYHKQIARKVRTQFIEGIYRSDYA